MFNLTVMMEICGISTCVGHITGTDSSDFFRMTISIRRCTKHTYNKAEPCSIKENCRK